MRLVLAILILGMVSFAAADVTVSNGMMSAEINSQSLQTVIQAQCTFSVDDSVRTSPVTASFQNLPIAEGIKKLLEGTGINYAVIGDSSGELQSIYIGSSERPGAPGQKLDTRPVNNRSVTQPVYRPQQQYQQQQQPQAQPDANRGNNPNEGRSVPPGMQKKMNGGAPAGQNASPTTPTLPPTGGGFGTQTPQQPNQPEVKPTLQNQNSAEDEEDSDEDDEE
jgi:hypothetical protein